MKKLLAYILSVICLTSLLFSLVCFTGCNNESQTAYCYVTFKQAGQEDVKIQVEKGKGLNLSEIDPPVQKDGYVITWEDVDLSVVTSDIVINAVEKELGYKISFNYDCPYDIEEDLLTELYVGYGESFNLPNYVGVSGNKMFAVDKWLTEDGDEYISGLYLEKNDIVLNATWKEWTKTTDISSNMYSAVRGVYYNNDGIYNAIVLESDGSIIHFTNSAAAAFTKNRDEIKSGYYLLTQNAGEFQIHASFIEGNSYSSDLIYDAKIGAYKFSFGVLEYTQSNVDIADLSKYESFAKTYEGEFPVPIKNNEMSEELYEGSIAFNSNGALFYRGFDPFVKDGGNYATLRTGIGIFIGEKEGRYILFSDNTILMYIPQMVIRLGGGSDHYAVVDNVVTTAKFNPDDDSITVNSGEYWKYQTEKVYKLNEDAVIADNRETKTPYTDTSIIGEYLGAGKSLKINDNSKAVYGGEDVEYSVTPSMADVNTGKIVIKTNSGEITGKYDIENGKVKVTLSGKYVYIKRLPTQTELYEKYAGTYTATYNEGRTMSLTLSTSGKIVGTGTGPNFTKQAAQGWIKPGQSNQEAYYSPSEHTDRHMGQSTRNGSYFFQYLDGKIRIYFAFDEIKRNTDGEETGETWRTESGQVWEKLQKINPASGYYSKLRFAWNTPDIAKANNIPVEWSTTVIWDVYNLAIGTACEQGFSVMFEQFSDSNIALSKVA